MKSALSNLKEERGSVFPLLLVLFLMSALMIPALLSHMETGIVSGNMYDAKSEELYAADAGVMDALWVLQTFNTLEEVDGYYYELEDPVNNKTVQYTIEIDTDEMGEDIFIIKSIATSSDGSSTTIEAWIKRPIGEPVALFGAAALNGDLELNAAEIGTATQSFDETTLDVNEITEVFAGDGNETCFKLEEVIWDDGGYGTPDVTVTVTHLGQDTELTLGTDYTVDYYKNQLVFDTAPSEGDVITATYSYYINRVNIYANGNIYFQGSAEVYADCWVTDGHIVEEPGGSAIWRGKEITSDKLEINISLFEIPFYEDPRLANWTDAKGNVKISDDIGFDLGHARIKGDLWVGNGANINLIGNVWVEGTITINGGTITCLNEDGIPSRFPHKIVTTYDEKTDDAVAISGGDITAFIYAESQMLKLSGSPYMENGAIIAEDNLVMTGSGDFQNNLPLYADNGTYEDVKILVWKIY